MKKLTPFRLWSFVFGLWGLFLTGIFASFLGSPGIIQALRLKGLLESKQAQLDLARAELLKLQFEATALENSKVAQQREIRRVLGYAAADEIIFDFSNGNEGL